MLSCLALFEEFFFSTICCFLLIFLNGSLKDIILLNLFFNLVKVCKISPELLTFTVTRSLVTSDYLIGL